MKWSFNEGEYNLNFLFFRFLLIVLAIASLILLAKTTKADDHVAQQTVVIQTANPSAL